MPRPRAAAVAFYRDMQRDLPTHPGRWPNSLGRSTDVQRVVNRLVSDRACVPLRGTIQRYQCDEYPFAATAEGAASGPRGVNWDVRLMPNTHNQRVGGLLSAFYQDQRMFMGVDRFYVDIVP